MLYGLGWSSAPVRGEVYGLPFRFPGKSYVEVHPGLVLGVKDLGGGKYEILAVPISHKEPHPHEPCLVVPLLERMKIGLDEQHQRVFYAFIGRFTLPKDAKKLVRLDAGKLGSASDAFFNDVWDAVREYRNGAIRRP